MFEEKRSILEPAGALSLAGGEAYCKYYGLKGANVVAVTSGANMNFNRLRVVADVGRHREAVLATYMPEEPRSFKRFCDLMGGRSNVKDELLCRFVFPERPGAVGETGADVLVGIQVSDAEMGKFRERANSLGYEYEMETENEAFQLLMR
ncbi:hypothetical protein SASPL_102204 [Salvia splendens]|uniref:ACT-like domain-containing protein n=1 Tax=Salvia splendens TaxID=180675 RepID=A0A8X8YT82_SALSN|nr:hypothetical protein SASPL_102204 [Salvia splendens]